MAAEGRSRRVGYHDLLRQRDLRFLLLATAVSSTGAWAYSVGILAYVYERTHSVAWVGAAGVVRMLTAFVASPVAGIVAERRERVRLMAAADAICTTLQFGLVAVAAWHGTALLAIILASLNTAIDSVTSPATAALLPQLVDEDRLVAANGLNEAINNLVVIVGPGLGALLLLIGPATVFAVNGVSFAFAAVLVSRVSIRSTPIDVTSGGEVGPLRQLLAGVSALSKLGPALWLVALSLLTSFMYGVDTVQLVAVSTFRLGTGARGFGYLLAALGLGGLIAALLVNRLAASGRLTRVVVAGMAAYALPSLGLLATHQPAVAFGLEVVRGAGEVVVDVVSISLLQRLINPDLVARVFGIFWSAVTLSIAMGAFFAPILIDNGGLDLSLIVMGTFPLALSLLAAPFQLSNERRSAARTSTILARADVLTRLAPFESAPRASLEALAAAAIESTVDTGEVVVREGDLADALWVLVSGEVAVSSVGQSGGPAQHIRTMSAPTYFGEIGVLGRIPRTATVAATEPCTLWRIAAEDFRQATLGLPLGANFSATAKARLRVTHPDLEPDF